MKSARSRLLLLLLVSLCVAVTALAEGVQTNGDGNVNEAVKAFQNLAAEVENYKIKIFQMDGQITDAKNRLEKLNAKVEQKSAIAEKKTAVLLSARNEFSAGNEQLQKLNDTVTGLDKRIADAQIDLAAKGQDALQRFGVLRNETEALQKQMEAVEKRLLSDQGELDQQTTMRKAFEEQLTDLNLKMQQRVTHFETELSQEKAWKLANETESVKLLEIGRALSGEYKPGPFLRSSWRSDPFQSNLDFKVKKDLMCVVDSFQAGYFFIDGGSEAFDGWGQFRISDMNKTEINIIPFFKPQAADGEVYKNMFTHGGEQWRVVYGWLAGGMFRFEVKQMTGAIMDFLLMYGGSYGRPPAMGTDYGWSEAEVQSNLLNCGYKLYTHWNKPLDGNGDRPIVTHTVVPFLAQQSCAANGNNVNSVYASNVVLAWTEDVVTDPLQYGATVYIQWGRADPVQVQEYIVVDLQEREYLDERVVRDKAVGAETTGCQSPPANCRRIESCEECVSKSYCGWCAARLECMDGSAKGPFADFRCVTGWVYGPPTPATCTPQIVYTPKKMTPSYKKQVEAYQKLSNEVRDKSIGQQQKSLRRMAKYQPVIAPNLGSIQGGGGGSEGGLYGTEYAVANPMDDGSNGPDNGLDNAPDDNNNSNMFNNNDFNNNLNDSNRSQYNSFNGSGFNGSGFNGSGFNGSGFNGSGFNGSGFTNGTAWNSSSQYNSSQFNSSQFNSSQFNSSQFNSSQFNSSQFNSSQFNSSQFNSSQFGVNGTNNSSWNNSNALNGSLSFNGSAGFNNSFNQSQSGWGNSSNNNVSSGMNSSSNQFNNSVGYSNSSGFQNQSVSNGQNGSLYPNATSTGNQQLVSNQSSNMNSQLNQSTNNQMNQSVSNQPIGQTTNQMMNQTGTNQMNGNSNQIGSATNQTNGQSNSQPIGQTTNQMMNQTNSSSSNNNQFGNGQFNNNNGQQVNQTTNQTTGGASVSSSQQYVPNFLETREEPIRKRWSDKAASILIEEGASKGDSVYVD